MSVGKSKTSYANAIIGVSLVLFLLGTLGWLVINGRGLTRAFKEAKAAAAPYMTPDEIAGYEKEREVLGEDPYAYVMEENEKRTLKALNRYQIEQGLMRRELPIEQFFVGHA